MGFNMKEKQAVTREYRSRYQKAAKKEKRTLPDEFPRLTGCHRKSAIRLLSAMPVREVLVTVDGTPIKLKPEKKRPANRKGKRAYTDEAIAALRLIWAFFRYKRAGNEVSAKSLLRLCGSGRALSPNGRPFTSPGKRWKN
jgi:hypothetical protein